MGPFASQFSLHSTERELPRRSCDGGCRFEHVYNGLRGFGETLDFAGLRETFHTHPILGMTQLDGDLLVGRALFPGAVGHGQRTLAIPSEFVAVLDDVYDD